MELAKIISLDVDSSISNSSTVSRSYFKIFALVVVIIVVSLILYFAISNFASNSSKRGMKNKKKKETKQLVETFNVEEEVEKLRKKQDNLKAGM